MTQLTMDDQLQRVELNTDSLWYASAMDALETVAERMFVFTTDDVWAEMNNHSPREPRAMGAIMAKAKRLGLIEATSMYQPTKREASNHRPIRVWKSLIKS